MFILKVKCVQRIMILWSTFAVILAIGSSVFAQELEVVSADSDQKVAPKKEVQSTKEPQAEVSERQLKSAIGQSVTIELNSGRKIQGTLDSVNSDIVTLSYLPHGSIKVDRSSIVNLKRSPQNYYQQLSQTYSYDPNRTRYLYSPSGFRLKSGEGYISQKEIFFTSMAVGITDNLAIVGGTFLPGLLSSDADLFMFALGFKYATELNENWQLLAGAEVFSLPFVNQASLLGIGFTGVTFGNEQVHATLNLGQPMILGESTRSFGGGVVSLSAFVRVSERIGFITENWYVNSVDEDFDELYVSSVGLRFISGNFAIDGALLMSDTEVPIPWVDFAYNF